MNARTHYISLLRSPDIRNISSSITQNGIRNGLIEWILCRKYWSADDCLDKLASDLDVTREEISTFLYYRTGCRLRTIKKELRLSDAKQLLLQYPDMPIYKISRCVGIGDKSNFRKLFRDNVGCTPADWRKGRGYACLCRIISHRTQ